MNGKLFQRTREHLRPKGTNEGPPTPTCRLEENPAPTFPGPSSATALGQESLIKTAATSPTEVGSNPVAPATLMEDANPDIPTSTEKTSKSLAKPRSEDEVIVVRGRDISFQPKSQVTRSGRQTQVPARFKDWEHFVEMTLISALLKWHLVMVPMASDWLSGLRSTCLLFTCCCCGWNDIIT